MKCLVQQKAEEILYRTKETSPLLTSLRFLKTKEISTKKDNESNLDLNDSTKLLRSKFPTQIMTINGPQHFTYIPWIKTNANYRSQDQKSHYYNY